MALSHVLALGLVLPSAAVAGEWLHPFDHPQAAAFPEELWVVVEIPQGGSVKYEIDHATGRLFVDRFPVAPVAYPVNYGSIPGTRNDDGDPADALVIARDPVAPGAFICVRPIGLMRMVDGGDADDKVVAVPVSRVDPTYDGVSSVSALPAALRARIESFFRSYKQLGPAPKPVEVKGWEEPAAAKAVLVRTALLYRKTRKEGAPR